VIKRVLETYVGVCIPFGFVHWWQYFVISTFAGGSIDHLHWLFFLYTAFHIQKPNKNQPKALLTD